MTVTKETNGKWRVDISNGINALSGDRNRHRKTGFRTRKEAEEYEANFRVFTLNQLKLKDKVTISYLYKLLKEEDILRGNKRGTVDTQESYYNSYTSKFFINADMKLVSISEVKAYREWLQSCPSVKGGTLSNSHINQQMIFVHKLFDICIANGFRSDNPCDSIKKLPEHYKEMSYYTPAQFKLFDSLFAESEYSFQLLFRILMYTGVRIGEALALNWYDIDFDDNCIMITKTAYYRKGKVHIGSVKTAQSKRRIYVHGAFVDELKKWQGIQAQLLQKFTNDLNSLQVVQNSPEILTAPNVANFKKKLQKRFPEGLKPIRNHDFRHSHAAFLINEGLRNGEGKDYIFFTLMKRLGHSSITTTINVYSHLFPSQQKEVASAFDHF